MTKTIHSYCLALVDVWTKSFGNGHVMSRSSITKKLEKLVYGYWKENHSRSRDWCFAGSRFTVIQAKQPHMLIYSIISAIAVVKQFFLYQQRLFTLLGKSDASLVKVYPIFKLLLNEVTESNQLIEACKVYLARSISLLYPLCDFPIFE